MDSSRLEAILEAEASGYMAFVTRLPLKLALIKRGQPGVLEQFLEREQAEQKLLRTLERDRQAEAAVLAVQLGLPAKASLTDIIERLDPQPAARLRKLSDRLVNVAKRLKEGNERCELLLKSSLDFIRYSMELVTSLLNPEERLADMLYGPQFGQASVASRGLLNRTA